MSRITISTSGIPVGRKGRALDLDAATTIIDLMRRGYIVRVDDHPSSPYSMSLYGLLDEEPFSMQVRPYYFHHDARLFDPGDNGFDPPDWWAELTNLIRKIKEKQPS